MNNWFFKCTTEARTSLNLFNIPLLWRFNCWSTLFYYFISLPTESTYLLSVYGLFCNFTHFLTLSPIVMIMFTGRKCSSMFFYFTHINTTIVFTDCLFYIHSYQQAVWYSPANFIHKHTLCFSAAFSLFHIHYCHHILSTHIALLCLLWVY